MESSNHVDISLPFPGQCGVLLPAFLLSIILPTFSNGENWFSLSKLQIGKSLSGYFRPKSGTFIKLVELLVPLVLEAFSQSLIKTKLVLI